MVDVARTFCILCLWALWVLITAVHCVKTRATVVLLKKQRQRHFGGKMPCWPIGVILASLSLSYVYISLKNWRGQNSFGIYGMGCCSLLYTICCTSQERKNPFSPLYSRERTVGKKYVCPSRITVLKAFLLPCWKWPYHAGILELWRVKSHGVGKQNNKN